MINNLDIDPGTFYSYVSIVKSVDDNQINNLAEAKSIIVDATSLIKEQSSLLAKANNDMMQEARNTLRTKNNPFNSIEEQQSDFSDFTSQISDVNFLIIAYDTVRSIYSGYLDLLDLIIGLKPKQLILSHEKPNLNQMSIKDIQNMTYEISINVPVISPFINCLDRINNVDDIVNKTSDKVYRSLDSYYKKLLNRHSVEGFKIHKDPVTTDIALMLYKNIDAHGEIASGKDPNKISAYTLRKAEILANTLREKSINRFVRDPGSLIDYLCKNLSALNKASNKVKVLFNEQIRSYKSIVDTHNKWASSFDIIDRFNSFAKLENTLTAISDVDPRNVSYTEPNKILSSEERFNVKYREETTCNIVKILSKKDFSGEELIKYILERKADLRTYFRDENSFYVSKIGGGNPFTGIAPGALEIIPGQRPNVNLNNIVGSGFQEVKNFISSIEDTAKWHSLFLATSPSKTTDKSNVLLVGPAGAGKTEVFRAVGTDKKSISISVQGSDFNTCWKGEMEKNPKRLFEGAVKLHKESGKHVHILIDEIDSVLNNDRGLGETNLSLEFQILMDGVVHYPKISIWGSTNNPGRIPMPMIRRFSKVLIVGELDSNDRITLLKHFGSFLPMEIFSNHDWRSLSEKLDGATGDVIRKIVDYIWREKMSWFVHNESKAADKLIKELNRDQSFNIADFTSKDRFNFNQKLGKYFKVSPKDFHKSIDLHLKNIAIISEINSAKKTYAESKAFLEQINSSKIIIT